MKVAVRLFPFVAFAIAACGGQSCSCLAPIPGGFPTDGRRHEGALQVRMTQGALDYLSANGKPLVDSLLPMGSTFNVPSSCGGKNEVCCQNGMPQPMCRLQIGVQKFQLTPKPPSALGFTVTAQLVSQDPIAVTFDTGFVGKAHCFATIDTTMSTTQFKTIDVASDATFAVDGTTDLTSINLNNTAVNNLDPSMITLKSQPGDFLCNVANWGPIKSYIVGQLKKNLADQIASTGDQSFCGKCKTPMDCDGWSDGCSGGLCQRGGKCLQEVGATGRLDIGRMLGNLSPSTNAHLDTISVLGGYAEVMAPNMGGVSLGLLGGGQGAPHSPCVPVRPAPDAPKVGKWMEEMAQTEPATGKPFHIGIGVHQSHLNTMAWAAFDGGALCLRVGTPRFPMLDSKTLSVLIPSLADLTHGRDVPVYLVMRPQQEPTMTIGAGTFDVDMTTGKKTIKDPLLAVSLPRLAMDFYAFLDDRYVRVFTLTGDLQLPVSLDVDGNGELVPLLGDLSKAFSNTSVSNSELLAEDPAKLAKAFPMLLGLAVGQVAGSLKPIALPALMGLKLQLVAVEPTDGQTFVSIFANLGLSTMALLPAETEASALRVIAPPTERFAVTAGMEPADQPRVELLLGGTPPPGADRGLEWSVSFDEGATWSPFSTASRQTVTDPSLWLQGRHALLVRARVEGQPSTTDPQPARVEFLVDTIAPGGTVEEAGGEAILHGSDNVSSPEALEYRVRPSSGAASPWQRSSRLALGALDAATTIEVRDEVGNVGALDFHGRTTSPSSAGCACSVGSGGRSRGGAILFVLLLGGALLVARRRAASGLALALALGLVVGGCGRDGVQLGKGDLEDPLDLVGLHSDAAATSGLIHVSAYDDNNGDLAYAEIDEGHLDAPIQWQWVDGVPSTGNTTPGGYRRGVTDPGDDVGLYSSIALTDGGDPRIAYFDRTNGQLKFAVASSSDRAWRSLVVDKPAAGVAGMFASLSLDKGNVPSIAYVVTSLPDGKGGFSSKLRLATAKSATPSGPGDWTTLDLDGAPIPCAGLCATGQACLLVDPKDATKGSACKATDAMCPMACAAGQACVAQACVAYLPPVKAPDLVEGTGLFAQLRRMKDGRRAVVYYDREQGDLKLALEGAKGSFAVATLDGNDPLTDVGQFAAAQVAPDDTLHVAYGDAIGDRLLYQRLPGAAAPKLPAMPEVIDDGLRMDGPRPVGGGAFLWTDGAAQRVVYQEQAMADLWQATRGGGGWSKQALKSGPPGYGFWPRIVSDGKKLFLTQLVYDRTNPSLGALAVSALP